jgi:hypothetical protein
VLVWGALIGLVHVWGVALNARGLRIFQSAPPLTGHIDPEATALAVPALAFAALMVAAGPRIAASAPWRTVLWAAGVAAFGWALLLALTSGADGLLRPVGSPLEYLHDVPRVGSPARFLAGFTERIGSYATHVRGHPPGMVLLLWGMDRIGLVGAWPAALIMVAGGAAAIPATLIAARDVAGERRARAAAPFLVLLPAAIWVAVTGDALFAGVGAWAAALVILATGRSDRRGDALAIAGGLLFGLGCLLSYGLVLLGLVPLAVAVSRRRAGHLVLAGGSALLLLALPALAGFSWVEGLLATRREYLLGAARARPYGYFLVANLAGFALALGPAVAGGLAVLRDRRTWLLVGAALAAAALADLSGMSKGEVERIWLPLVPWVALAAAAVATGRLRPRLWLGLSAGVALAVELGVRTPW